LLSVDTYYAVSLAIVIDRKIAVVCTLYYSVNVAGLSKTPIVSRKYRLLYQLYCIHENKNFFDKIVHVFVR